MFLRICDSNHCYLSLETVVNAVITVAVVFLVIKCFGDTTLERWRAGRAMDTREPQTTEDDSPRQWGVSDWWQMQGVGRGEALESSSAGLGIQVKRDEPDTNIAMLSAFTFESQPPSPPGERGVPSDHETKRQKRPKSATPPAKRQKQTDAPHTTSDRLMMLQKTATHGANDQVQKVSSDGASMLSQRPRDPPSGSLQRPVSPQSPVPTRTFLRKGSRKAYRAPLRRSPPPDLRYMATTRSLSPPPTATTNGPGIHHNNERSPPRLQPLEMSLTSPSLLTSTPPDAVAAIVNYGVGVPPSARPQLQPRYCKIKAFEVKTAQRLPHPYLKSKSALERSLRRSAAIGGAADRNSSRPGHSYAATASSSRSLDGPVRELSPGAHRNFVSDPAAPRENFAGQLASLIANQYNAFVQEYESFRNRNVVRHNLPHSQPPTNTFAWPESSTGKATSVSSHLAPSQVAVDNAPELESSCRAIGSHAAVTNMDEERANSNDIEQPPLHAKQALNVFVQESDCTCGTAAPVKGPRADSRSNEIQEKQRQEGMAGRSKSPPAISFAPRHAAGHELAIIAQQLSNAAEAPALSSCTAYSGRGVLQSRSNEQSGLTARPPWQSTRSRKATRVGRSPFYFTHCDICKAYPRYKNM